MFRLLSFLSLPVQLLRKPWMRIPLIVTGILALFAAIWFGFPMTGLTLFAAVWFRAAVIGAILFALALYYGLRWRRRRKRAQDLEDSLLQEPAGDAAVLSERLQEAMAKLKKAGGRNYLYDLPWYVIIGPPAAGKTTALSNAGIEFPGQDILPDKAQGFGGTRNCDFWFAEDAVLIDTAGRYTMHDSDAAADKASWDAFLGLLKKGRPDQPVNGVILAFSVEDMMSASPASIAAHAATVRARLGEIHETLRIDFPVYVLFTKADLISGFREYFASFSQSRRKSVWGVTFQTKDRSVETYKQAGAEFDQLISRLSDEVIDRMNEEPDGASRIAIFGLPGQMAMLRGNICEFLRVVFEPTRYKTSALLRGFYFTSGTQEGTPVDQVLGEMSRNSGDAGLFQPAFMSGKGRSYFLHDLMKKVIFEERGWVGFDRAAMRRTALLRSTAFAAILLGTAGSMGAFGYSYWQNATLTRNAEHDAVAFFDAARNELSRTVIDGTDPSLVMPHLQDLRDMTTGYGDPEQPGFWQGLGLSRHAELSGATHRAYSDGLERMLRPRLVLHLENAIPQLITDEDTAEVYRALKVYLLLGGTGQGNAADNDAAVTSYFEQLWRGQFNAPGQIDERQQLLAHLEALLDLDGDRKPVIGIDPEIVRQAREAIVNLPLAEQAYALIKERAATSGIPDFGLAERLSGQVAQVLETTDGTPLQSVGVPALYTFEGYWGYFLEELTTARTRLREDQWVLGEAAGRVGYETQLAGLEAELHRVYRLEFSAAWKAMFAQIGLARMSADAPQYAALAAASSQVASPLLELVEAVEEETRLSRFYDQLDTLDPAAVAASGGDLGANMGDAVFKRIYSKSGVFQKVALDSFKARGKVQTQAGAAGQAHGEDLQRRQVERISDDFAQWHSLLNGKPGQRPIDLVLAALGDLRENRRQAAVAPTPADEAMLSQSLSALTMNNTALPTPLAQLLNEAESEFRAEAQDAAMTQLNRALNDEVTQFCRDFIAPLYPFGSGRHVSPAVFGQFFGPGGRMDRYYTSYLQPHVVRSPDGLRPAPGSATGQRLSPEVLRQFSNAQAIQLAFFASGAPEPEVGMSIVHADSSPSVELAVLSVNGTSVRTQPGSTPAALSWPGQSSGVSVELFPQKRQRQSALSFTDGRWDIVTFLRQGRAKATGNVVDVRHEIGGRSISYRIEFDSTTVPFLMPELADFSCPVTLE
ncbi:type VI secretion system membrane subunit TssM (plasmid) [Leisingera sp. S132]|uniref:type VI secretion system membrane subunit TssM n=1 Tax=Leisingera sp. S132 TaxID=2867016 RepID=UPI0021A5684D|nr:type VI secretion system membrane subunit TssM [Leisingera sp. S132]UWQ81746.1 type VI secretion system membrane subunit TssM [Leisingera sp. S132]